MQTKKMSLANIQGKLSRTEMKNIMAGSEAGGCNYSCDSSCSLICNDQIVFGNCRINTYDTKCHCLAAC